MIKIEVSYEEWKASVSSKSLYYNHFKIGGDYRLIATDGPVYYYCHLSNSDDADFEANYLPTSNAKIGDKSITTIKEEPAFASKSFEGLSLFQRVEGVEFDVTTAANDNTLEFVIPYAQCKFTGLEIINGELGDKVSLNVLDDDSGSISGVPKYNLNTFGGKESLVNVAKDYYVRESSYDAQLYSGLYICIKYRTVSDKKVYVNYVLHEQKA